MMQCEPGKSAFTSKIHDLLDAAHLRGKGAARRLGRLLDHVEDIRLIEFRQKGCRTFEAKIPRWAECGVPSILGDAGLGNAVHARTDDLI